MVINFFKLEINTKIILQYKLMYLKCLFRFKNYI